MTDFTDILGEEEEVVYDKKSGKPVIWGRRVLKWLTEQEFHHLKKTLQGYLFGELFFANVMIRSIEQGIQSQ